MASANGTPANSQPEAGHGEAEEPQKATTGSTRPSRSAAGKANAKISAVALRETSPDEQENGRLLAESLTAFTGKRRNEALGWVDMESEPVRQTSQKS